MSVKNLRSLTLEQTALSKKANEFSEKAARLRKTLIFFETPHRALTPYDTLTELNTKIDEIKALLDQIKNDLND